MASFAALSAILFKWISIRVVLWSCASCVVISLICLCSRTWAGIHLTVSGVSANAWRKKIRFRSAFHHSERAQSLGTTLWFIKKLTCVTSDWQSVQQVKGQCEIAKALYKAHNSHAYEERAQCLAGPCAIIWPSWLITEKPPTAYQKVFWRSQLPSVWWRGNSQQSSSVPL